MEVRIVEEAKKVEKREVPFVVGGVYRYFEGYRQVVEVGGKYAIIDPCDGSDNGLTAGELLDEGAMTAYVQKYEYVPNAYLAIPKERE